MTYDNPNPSDFSRRAFLKTSATSACGGGLLAGVLGPTHAAQSVRSNVIAMENAKEGTLDWRLSRVRLDKSDGFRSLWIEGYCSRQSVKAGETIDIIVSKAPVAKFTIKILRTGYYGGKVDESSRAFRWQGAACAKAGRKRTSTNAAGNPPRYS
jgi:hypothetical protein